jgi:molecular chaperone HscB
MKLDDDDFTLFGLPPRTRSTAAALDQRWRQLQAEVHPDRFAAEGAAAQRWPCSGPCASTRPTSA